MSAHNATHVLFRASPPNYIDSQQLRKLPESFLRGGLACRSVPVRLKLAEAVKRQAHYLTGYLRGQWAWVKMALIKMEWTCLGSCETLSGVGWGGVCTSLCAHLHICVWFVCVCVCNSTKPFLAVWTCVCARACGGCFGNMFWLRPVLMWGEPGAGHITTLPPPPSANPPHCAFILSIPWQAPTSPFFLSLSPSLCLSLSLSIMVNNTLPHSRSVIAKKKKKKKFCRTPSFCCFYTSKNRQDKRKEPKGLSERGRER